MWTDTLLHSFQIEFLYWVLSIHSCVVRPILWFPNQNYGNAHPRQVAGALCVGILVQEVVDQDEKLAEAVAHQGTQHPNADRNQHPPLTTNNRVENKQTPKENHKNKLGSKKTQHKSKTHIQYKVGKQQHVSRKDTTQRQAPTELEVNVQPHNANTL